MRLLPIVKDGWIHVLVLTAFFGLLAAWMWKLEITMLMWLFIAASVIGIAFMLYFFRDPEREIVNDPSLVLSGADGKVRAVEHIDDPKYLGEPTVRVSVYLSPFNVHINRAPIAGAVKDLRYTPGKHLLTKSNASSEYNEHSSIFIQGEELACRVHQIVGPLVRRVVYWLRLEQSLDQGDRIGLMKFGSRLDVYLPAEKVDVIVAPGQRLKAGLTAIARIKENA